MSNFKFQVNQNDRSHFKVPFVKPQNKSKMMKRLSEFQITRFSFFNQEIAFYKFDSDYHSKSKVEPESKLRRPLNRPPFDRRP